MSEPVLRVIDPAEYAAWFEANRAELLGRSPCHEPAWLGAVARGTGFGLAFVGIYEGREMTAVVPGFLTRRGPFRLFGSPLRGTMTSYLGPVALVPHLRGEAAEDLLLACADFARREWRASYLRITTRDAPPDRSSPGPHWRRQRAPSYRLDLTVGEEALFAALRSHCRRNIRKAGREGVEIVPLDDASVFHRILDETFRRHGSVSWHSPRFFEALMTDLPPRGLLWSWGARYHERIIAAGLFLHDDHEMHYISGGSLPQYGSLPTSYLLHWHAIAAATREGLHVFSSDASRIRSIDQFKETFNPVRQQRGTLIWAPRSVWAAQRVFRTWHNGMRRVRSRLPARLGA